MLLSLFYLISGILVIGTLLPFIRKDHWTFRVFEFPRLQKLFLVLVALVLGFQLLEGNSLVPWALGILTAIFIYLVYLIFPFTPFSKKSVAGAPHSDTSFSLLIANVYQDNKRFHKLRKRIEATQPDLILLVETDKKWLEGLKECTDPYPYRIEHPRDNTYGLLFYSKLEILTHEIRFLVDQEFPSIKAEVKLPSGATTVFYGVHPPPPSPTENPYSTERDCELWLVAKEVETDNQPAIVAGDLNDVAWSYTTDRFLEISGLNDPRRGRGIYSTFHAQNMLMRWPLDHIFCSDHFKLVKMKRLKSIGSDHFPVYVELSSEVASRQR